MEKESRTSGSAWGAILGIWGALTALLVWRFLPWFRPDASVVVPAFLFACLSYFVLTGVFNIVVNAISHGLPEPLPKGGVKGTPRVALFYCTFNDFDPEAADTMLRLTYRPVDLWILDDSTDPKARAQADAFARDVHAQGTSIRIVRRDQRKGFKAGAINHALALLAPDVAYVGIVDADEFLTPAFVEGCLRHFADDVAFVQANHHCQNTERSWFTRYLGVGVDLHWRHYQHYRNRYGLVNMLGHGALIRRDVLNLVGGFPEVTCEDLAFTVEARMRGFRGAFAAEVMCGETFPGDFHAMRRRHLRWSWATVEFLRINLLRILRSRWRLHEKLDLLLPAINLPAVFLLVAFIGAVQGWRWSGGDLAVFRDPIIIALGAFASLAPLAMFADLLRRPAFALKAIIVNTATYIALFPVSVVGVVRGLLRPAEFLVTPKGVQGPLSLASAARQSRVEVAFGLALLALGFQAFGPWGVASPLALAALGVPILLWASRRALIRAEGLPPGDSNRVGKTL